MALVTAIILANREPRLKETVASVLAMAEGPVEVLCLLDGHAQRVSQDQRVQVVYEPELRGRRVRINQAAKLAQGDFFFHLDGHCRMLTRGWDKRMIEATWVNRYACCSILNLRPGKAHLIQHVGYDKRTLANRFLERAPTRTVEDAQALTGCGWMHARGLWRDFDERLSGWGYMGIELALRLWLCGEQPVGLNLRPDVVIEHEGRRHEGSTARTAWGEGVLTPGATLRELRRRVMAMELADQKRRMEWLYQKFE